jgi:uncharacterized protein (DUF427 family)
MARATWNGAVLAESGATRVVEGNHYFPSDTVRRQYLSSSTTHTTCPWKGEASYCGRGGRQAELGRGVVLPRT